MTVRLALDARAFAASVVLVFAAGCGGCDSGSTTEAPPTVDRGALLERIDFGKVAIGTKVARALSVANIGRSPLVLAAPEEESLDHAFNYSRQPLTVAVGAASGPSLTFEPVEAGLVTGGLVLHTNDPDNPVLRFEISGQGVEPCIELEGPVPVDGSDTRFVYDFGRVPVGKARDGAVRMINCSDAETSVRFLEIDPAQVQTFSAVAPDDAPLEPGRVRTLAPAGSAGDAQAMNLRFTPRQANDDVTLLYVVTADGTRARREFEIALLGRGVQSALDVSPCDIDFGAVPLSEEGTSAHAARRDVALFNAGDGDLVVTSAVLRPGSHSALAIEGDPLGSLAAQTGRSFAVLCTPVAHSSDARDEGLLRATLVLTASAAGQSMDRVCELRCYGGGPRIAALPSELDFKDVALGTPITRRVLLTNAGVNDHDAAESGDVLVIERIEIEGPAVILNRPEDVRHGLPTPEQPVALEAGGDAYPLAVQFRPSAAGPYGGDGAVIRVFSNDPLYAGRSFDIPYRGTGMDLPPCRPFAVAPSQVHFGVVAPGAERSIAIRFENRSDEASCLVNDVHLSADSDASFSIATPALVDTPFSLPPLGARDLVVTFAGAGDGRRTGRIDFLISDAPPERSVPLAAFVTRPCLTVDPPELDFGALAQGCASRTRNVSVRNSCDATVTVQSTEIVQEGASFEIVNGLPPNRALAAGASAEVSIRYVAGTGSESASLLFWTDISQFAPYLAVLRGAGTGDGRNVERFQQTERPTIDILFAIDNSGSMIGYQTSLRTSFFDFFSHAARERIDYQIGVVTSDTSASGGAGRLEGESAPIVHPLLPNPYGAFSANARVGTEGADSERMVQAASWALCTPGAPGSVADCPNPSPLQGSNAGLLRPEASLAVVLVSDEANHEPSDESAPTPCTAASRLPFFRSLKPNATDVALYTVARDCSFDGYSCPLDRDPSSETYGQCSGAPATPYSKSISLDDARWVEQLYDIADSARLALPRRFPLRGYPDDPSGATIAVRVDGALEAQFSHWTYSAAHNFVELRPDSVPSAGAQIEISYPSECLSP